MAILEKEILVKCGTKNDKYFESLGYEITRLKDKWGRFRVIKGSFILVKIKDLPKDSHVKVTKICDEPECGVYIPNQEYRNVLKFREMTDGKDRCKNCANKRISRSRIENISYENSLEYYALNNNKEYLLTEFSKKNIKKPFEITKGSKQKMLWNCSVCESEFKTDVVSRSEGRNCPYCSGVKVNETNSLFHLNPYLAKEWHPDKNKKLTPHNVTRSSNKKVWWLCSKCNHEWESNITNRNAGSGCPVCKESKGEKRIRTWLEGNNITFQSQKIFKKLIGINGGNLSYDFYLPKLNILIEYQGVFHDGESNEYVRENLKTQQEHDRRKRTYAKLHNIDLLEIWYWDFEKIEEILQKKLNKHLGVTS